MTTVDGSPLEKVSIILLYFIFYLITPLVRGSNGGSSILRTRGCFYVHQHLCFCAELPLRIDRANAYLS